MKEQVPRCGRTGFFVAFYPKLALPQTRIVNVKANLGVYCAAITAKNWRFNRRIAPLRTISPCLMVVLRAWLCHGIGKNKRQCQEIVAVGRFA
jgi:hypothetical protein